MVEKIDFIHKQQWRIFYATSLTISRVLLYIFIYDPLMMTNQVETDINDINTEIMGMIHSRTGDSLPFQHFFTLIRLIFFVSVCAISWCKRRSSNNTEKQIWGSKSATTTRDLTNEMYLPVCAWKKQKKRNLRSKQKTEPTKKPQTTRRWFILFSLCDFKLFLLQKRRVNLIR